ncbi:MAG TPA: hypothetical protein VHP33_33240 [Polyangiaceae bacterium]|nr:hypothetical protein [Polyangiaceae bacterium]
MLKFVTAFSLVLAAAPAIVACGGSDPEGTSDGAAGTMSSAAGTASTAAGSNTGGSASATAGTGNGTSGSSNGGASAGGTSSGTAGTSTAGSGGGGTGTPSTEKFSFFVTSLKAMRELSGSNDGFGGDLRFGETGDGAGLKGADKICKTIAEKSMAGNNKTWKAFLSANKGENGGVVNAIDRIGTGPWYDRTGRLIAQNVTDILTERPTGADTAIVNDLPNEDGVPNHDPDGTGDVDNHDVLTGTNDKGKVFNADGAYTCNDWTSKESSGSPRVGHSWPRLGGPGGGGLPGGGGGGGSMNNWMSALNEAGCAPGAFIIEMGPPGANGTKSVGDGGGYGGIYCFALTP